MQPRPERCDRCGNWTIEKDNQPLGPLEGKYEYLCKKCARIEEMFGPLRWKGGGTERFGRGSDAVAICKTQRWEGFLSAAPWREQI